jgi:hypothetical protein
MSSRAKTGGRDFEPPKAEIRRIAFTERGGEIIVRLTNDNDRAVHYVADVRAMLFDASARRLTIRLSDTGRVLVAGLAAVEPDFRYIDPHSDAELQLLIPSTMVKLAGGTSANEEVLFEEHELAGAAEIVVEVAWADTPFYQDPRQTKVDRYPAAIWEQGRAVASATIGSGKEPERRE